MNILFSPCDIIVEEDQSFDARFIGIVKVKLRFSYSQKPLVIIIVSIAPENDAMWHS